MADVKKRELKNGLSGGFDDGLLDLIDAMALEAIAPMKSDGAISTPASVRVEPTAPVYVDFAEIEKILPYSVDLRSAPYIYLAIIPNAAYAPVPSNGKAIAEQPRKQPIYYEQPIINQPTSVPPQEMSAPSYPKNMYPNNIIDTWTPAPLPPQEPIQEAIQEAIQEPITEFSPQFQPIAEMPIEVPMAEEPMLPFPPFEPQASVGEQIGDPFEEYKSFEETVPEADAGLPEEISFAEKQLFDGTFGGEEPDGQKESLDMLVPFSYTPPVYAHFTQDKTNAVSNQKPKSTMRKIMMTASNIFIFAFCVVIFAGAITFTQSDDPEKSFFGYRFYNVLTPSMTPTIQADGTMPKGGFRAGDLIFVKMTNPEDVKVGDIVTFNPDGNTQDGVSTTTLTHRVVRVLDELGGEPGIYFVTKGDSNNANDPPISGESIIGVKKFHIPFAGKVLNTAKNNIVLTIVFSAALLVFVFVLFYFFSKDEFHTAKPKKATKKQNGRA
ncbi:MAG: signal peptidase I [Oscillospiraceae bacterium]|nr:signal peptidase I [Oscillospiraceae bacterium]